jgi:hypothetical protein
MKVKRSSRLRRYRLLLATYLGPLRGRVLLPGEGTLDALLATSEEMRRLREKGATGEDGCRSLGGEKR